MRAKPSSTASGMYRRSGPLTPPIPICADPLLRGQISKPAGRGSPDAGSETELDEGLLHDARNLMGAIRLYCDLLSMHDVLKPEHRHYAEELRLLGTRSGALIQRLMEHRMQSSLVQGQSPQGPGTGAAWEAGAARSLALAKVREAEGWPVESPVPSPTPVSLRAIVERCSGLLSQVADSRVIEVSYGAAASVPVPVGEEAVENPGESGAQLGGGDARAGTAGRCGCRCDGEYGARLGRGEDCGPDRGRDSGVDPDWGGSADQSRG